MCADTARTRTSFVRHVALLVYWKSKTLFMENRLLPIELKSELGMKYRICKEECLCYFCQDINEKL